MPINFGKAVRTNRGVHPDLTEDGELRDDLDLPAYRRDFNRMAAEGGPQWQAFYDQVAREQAQLPEDVQEAVAGQVYQVGDAFSNYMEYRRDVERMRRVPGNPLTEITGADVAKMDLATYEQYFDANGRPKDGVTFHPTGRDVNVTTREGIDPFSQRELRNR